MCDVVELHGVLGLRCSANHRHASWTNVRRASRMREWGNMQPRGTTRRQQERAGEQLLNLQKLIQGWQELSMSSMRRKLAGCSPPFLSSCP